MKTIFKYLVEVRSEQSLRVPHGSKVLCVQVQRGIPCLWIEHDADVAGAAKQTLIVSIYGTGHPVPDEPGRYVGTVQMDGGSLVWHVYVRDAELG